MKMKKTKMKTMTLKTYKVANKIAWENIKKQYSGLVFSRQEKGMYLLRMPPKYAKQLLLMNIITEHEQSTSN